jgi:hypothetical protein
MPSSLCIKRGLSPVYRRIIRFLYVLPTALFGASPDWIVLLRLQGHPAEFDTAMVPRNPLLRQEFMP